MSKKRDNLEYMQRRFGKTDKGCCRECCHCLMKQVNGVFYKCEVYGYSNSVATDFPVTFFGCGLFNKETSLRNVYKERKGKSKEELQKEMLFGEASND